MEKPAYKIAFDYICDKIASGELKKGDRVPSENELSERFAVSRITSKRALDSLAERGIIIRKQGKGSFVGCDSLPALPEEPGPPQENPVPDPKPRMLGLILPDFADSFGMELIAGFEKACFDRDCHFVLKRSYGSRELETMAIESMIELGVSGIGIMPLHGEFYNTAVLQLILDGFPVVIIDRHYPGINSCFVGTNNIGGAKTAVNHLIGEGHRNIAFLSPPVQDNSALRGRIQGMQQAFEDAGLTPEESLWFDQINSTLPLKNKPQAVEANIHVLRKHFESHPEITAVFAAEYNIALIAKKTVQSMGLRVPEDISIVCFDSPGRMDNTHEFTHIKQDERGIAKYAVNKLVNFQGENAYSFFLLDGKLVIGRSTKPLKKR